MTRSLFVGLLMLSACGENRTYPTKEAYAAPAVAPLECVPNLDGRIDATGDLPVSGYAPVLPRVEEVLGSIGRMKYLKPLYRALAKRPETSGLARDLFARHRGTYHPIAQQVVRGLLA